MSCLEQGIWQLRTAETDLLKVYLKESEAHCVGLKQGISGNTQATGAGCLVLLL